MAKYAIDQDKVRSLVEQGVPLEEAEKTIAKEEALLAEDEVEEASTTDEFPQYGIKEDSLGLLETPEETAPPTSAPTSAPLLDLNTPPATTGDKSGDKTIKPIKPIIATDTKKTPAILDTAATGDTPAKTTTAAAGDKGNQANQTKTANETYDPNKPPTPISAEEYKTYKPYLVDLETESAKLAPALATELKAAQEEYKTAKNTVASKEMWDSIIKGIGHLAAGVIGMQTGLNLGGLKFDQKDWAAERAIIERELQTARANAKESMTTQQQEIAAKRAQRMDDWKIEDSLKERALNIAKFNATELSQWHKNKQETAAANARATAAAAAAAAKDAIATERYNKAQSRLDKKEELEEAKLSKKTPKLTPEQKAATVDLARESQNRDEALNKIAAGKSNPAILARLKDATQKINENRAILELPPKYPENSVVEEKGGWFTNPFASDPNSYTEIQKRENAFKKPTTAQPAPSKTPILDTPEGTIKMRAPDGQLMDVPLDQVEDAKAANYKVI